MNAIIYDMPDEEYRAAEGFNASGLKKTIRSLAHWKADQDEKPEPTKALIFGIVFHHHLLTPEDPMRVTVKPDGLSLATKEGKAWKASLPDGAMIITQDEEDAIFRMVEKIKQHPNARAAFGEGKAEVSVFHEYKHPLTGEVIQLKGRMDFVNDGGTIVDAKTCEDARPASFAQAAVEFGYFWQAAFYLNFLWNPVCDILGTPELKKHSFVFVAVEKTPPYAVKPYCVVPGAIDLYTPRIEEEIAKYAIAKRTGYYPAYPQDVALLAPPEWGVRREVNNSMKLEATVDQPIAQEAA